LIFGIVCNAFVTALWVDHDDRRFGRHD